MNELRTLTELLEYRAERQAGQPAYIFSADGDTFSEILTYSDLQRRASRLAARLGTIDARGHRALLAFPPGTEFLVAFFACQIAGLIPVPIEVPRRRQEKANSIVRDCQPSLLLSTRATLSESARWCDEESALKRVEWVAIEDADRFDGDTRRPPKSEPDDLAYLQYTSGATSDPKGVMITQANLLSNLEYIQHVQQNDRQSSSVNWLPHFHDMGLVEGLLEPLYCGYPCRIFPPAAFVRQPIRWLRAISRFGATNTGAPNFAYDLCVQKITDREARDLDLSHWRVAYCGSEPIHPKTLREFYEKFRHCGFRWQTLLPCYGLAEGTLLVTGYRLNEPPEIHHFDAQRLQQGEAVKCAAEDPSAQTLAASGKARYHTTVRIVEPQTRRQLPDGKVGEIWIKSPSVAAGYWGVPVREGDEFRSYTVDPVEGPFLRTADLGFLDDEDLYVSGRLKEIVIVRGRNLYPADIEAAVQNVDDRLVKNSGAAFSLPGGIGDRLVVVQEVKRGADVAACEEILNRVRERIIDHCDVLPHRIVLVRMLSVPKTSSGKVMRFACRDAYLHGKLHILAES